MVTTYRGVACGIMFMLLLGSREGVRSVDPLECLHVTMHLRSTSTSTLSGPGPSPALGRGGLLATAPAAAPGPRRVVDQVRALEQVPLRAVVGVAVLAEPALVRLREGGQVLGLEAQPVPAHLLDDAAFGHLAVDEGVGQAVDVVRPALDVDLSPPALAVVAARGPSGPHQAAGAGVGRSPGGEVLDTYHRISLPVRERGTRIMGTPLRRFSRRRSAPR